MGAGEGVVCKFFLLFTSGQLQIHNLRGAVVKTIFTSLH